MTNPHCRIGKVHDKKTGNSVYRFPDRDLTVYDSGHEFDSLKYANNLVREGRAVCVSIVVIDRDGTTYRGFEKKKGVKGLQVLGSIELLRDYATRWMVDE